MLSNSVETLNKIKASTGKFAKWYVRVSDPKVKDYTFDSRGEKIQAHKFECALVSQDPSQYMMGLVPFDFKNRQAASNAETTFRRNSAWEVTMPAFDAKTKPDYIRCPLKAVLLLKAPRN